MPRKSSLSSSSQSGSLHKDIKICRKTWKEVGELVPNWHETFFELLFQQAPGSRSLFSFDLSTIRGNQNLAEHATRVANALETALQGLDAYQKIIPVLKALGARHAHYDVRPEHMDTFEIVFLLTLEAAFGARWTHQLQKSWKNVIEMILDPVRQEISRTIDLEAASVASVRGSESSFLSPTPSNPKDVRDRPKQFQSTLV